MSPPEAPNPERRSSSAMLVFCFGAGLCILAYVLGIGAIMGAAFSNGDPAVVFSTLLGGIGVVLMGVIGFVVAIIGGIWMIAQVIADQSSGAEEKRYRDVER
jgi:purine-cytosine permease-like protein